MLETHFRLRRRKDYTLKVETMHKFILRHILQVITLMIFFKISNFILNESYKEVTWNVQIDQYIIIMNVGNHLGKLVILSTSTQPCATMFTVPNDERVDLIRQILYSLSNHLSSFHPKRNLFSYVQHPLISTVCHVCSMYLCSCNNFKTTQHTQTFCVVFISL